MKVWHHFHSYKLLLIIYLYFLNCYLPQQENLTKFDISSNNQLMIFPASKSIQWWAGEKEEEKRLGRLAKKWSLFSLLGPE